MDEVWVENFRCFREEQRARLAPLTLLVGENSTGKTSFMAMIRALTDASWSWEMPDFKESPYDLGSFDEIVTNQGRRSDPWPEFCGGFYIDETKNQEEKDVHGSYSFTIDFGRQGSVPIPVRRVVQLGSLRVEEILPPDEQHFLTVGTSRGTWKVSVPREFHSVRILGTRGRAIMPLAFVLAHTMMSEQGRPQENIEPIGDSPPIELGDIEDLQRAAYYQPHSGVYPRAHASAPIRSQPKRTYEPTRVSSDPEGQFVPMYLANLHLQDKAAWETLKGRLETFGRAGGLFDDISIRFVNKPDVDPFQVQIRKGNGRKRGQWRNLVDVGYGVSQVLPVITEMVRPDAASMFLLQQPEVHLHPTAQAALGTLFCQVAASSGPQLIVETHSDYIIDRVRMEIRDGVSGLRPEDVSILYFERRDLDVRIHSINIDKEGNIIGAPEGYRQFFTDELERSLWGSQTKAKA